MSLPADLTWLEPVLIAAVIVFVVDLIGNMLHFSNRFVNAFVTALVFTVIFGAISYFLMNGGKLPSVATPAAVTTPAQN